jgi:hypothetical protein
MRRERFGFLDRANRRAYRRVGPPSARAVGPTSANAGMLHPARGGIAMPTAPSLWRYLRRHHVALLALFVALGGTSYAAVKLPRNSVGTQQLKNGGVRAADVGSTAITTPKLKNGAVTGAKVAGDSLTGVNVLESSLGPVPAANSAGSATEAQHAGVAATLESATLGVRTFTNIAGQVTTGATSCPAGLTPVAMGVQVSDPSSQFLIDNFPNGSGWSARVANTDTTDHSFTTFLSCTSVGRVTPAP